VRCFSGAGMCIFEVIQHVCPCDAGAKCTQQYRGMADAQRASDGRIIIGHRMEFYSPAEGRPCALQRFKAAAAAAAEANTHGQSTKDNGGGAGGGNSSSSNQARADPVCPERDYAACPVVDTRLHPTLCNDCASGWTGAGCAGVK
jgi:hypothetical protein